MTVHIREFVLRLGVDGEDGHGGHPQQQDRPGVSQEDLDELYRELMREMRSLAGGSRAQPFDR